MRAAPSTFEEALWRTGRQQSFHDARALEAALEAQRSEQRLVQVAAHPAAVQAHIDRDRNHHHRPHQQIQVQAGWEAQEEQLWARPLKAAILVVVLVMVAAGEQLLGQLCEEVVQEES